METLKEFKGMLWGQRIKVYTDHKNLTRDALGLTSDLVYRWRLILKEYGPDVDNKLDDILKCWCKYKLTHNSYSMNNVFANRSEEEKIYPLTVKEISEAQRLD